MKTVFYKKTMYISAVIFFIVLISGSHSYGWSKEKEFNVTSNYERWRSLGEFIAEFALDSLEKRAVRPQKTGLIVMTNAGYSEIGMESTQAVLDGLSSSTGATRGRHTLVEVHSALWDPLWCAFYDRKSGYCVYLEVDSSKMEIETFPLTPELFSRMGIERINAEYLFKHSSEWQRKFKENIFGGNEFRIITIANAIASGAPTSVVRAFEFHDHYCPGVTSGILMAEYLKAHFPPGKGGYFVHTVEPWCKEDALLVLLNATPGKRGYAVCYPTKEDKARRVPEVENASTIIYRQNEGSKKWEGIILSFGWAETACPKTGSSLIDKLCMDLWYLKHLDRPEDFVKVIKTFELPEGVSPRDWARPGVDPLRMLGLIK